MVFIDSNIPMYLIGADHPNKHDTLRRLEQLITEKKRLVTDAEVLQEILHRYRAINRMDWIQPAFNALLGIVDEVYSVNQNSVNAAKDILLGSSEISARDALHVAVMRENDIEQIFSFDVGFDEIPGIQRIS